MKKLYLINQRKLHWELLLIIFFIFVCPSISKALSYGTDLVTNGDGSNLTGWDLAAGPTFVSYAPDGEYLPNSPNGGNVFDFYRGDETIEYITQTIDLTTDFGTDINNGIVKAVLNVYLYRSTSSNISRAILDQLNSSNTVVATSQVENDGVNTWQLKTITIDNLNTSTRKIRIRLLGQLIGTSGSDAVDFDGIQLTLTRWPAVTNTAASSITASSAVLGGNVTTDGNPSATRGIVYSTTNTNPTIGGANVTQVALGTGAGTFSQNITGLSGAQTYYYNAYATNTLGTVYGTVNNFTTLTPTYLTATTNDATNVTINSATLNGSVNANGNTTNCYFQYGTTISYGTQVAASPATATGTSATTETISITGLSNSTTYHFRMAAYNSTEGWKYGDDKTFTTLTPVPEIGLKQNTTAIADGGSYDFSYLQPSSNTDITFTIENTGTKSLAITTPIVISGTDADQFSVQSQPSSSVAVSGNTTFIVRFAPTSIGNKTATISITNDDSDENPYDFTITGQGYLPPTVATNAVSSLKSTTVTLNGSINANNNSTTATFEYGPTTSYGSSVTASQSPVAGTSTTTVSYALSGLTSNTLYHYRTVGTNLGGTINGADQTFTTPIIEHFTDESEYGLSFTADGYSFTLTGNLKADYWVGHGFNGFTFDQWFISNYDVMLTSAGIMGSIKNATNNFYANSLWVAPGDASKTLGQYGDVIVRGKRSGTTLFSYTLTSANTNNNYAIHNNYTLIDLSAYNSILIDELEFEVTDDIRSLEIDAFSFNVPATFDPTVTTQAVSNIGSTNATGNGNITDLGNPNPTTYGICYGTTVNPDVTGSKVDLGAASATGAFTAQITGLTPGTSYHVRAFATNSAGTSYGDDVSFTTSPILTAPGNALNFDGTNDYVIATDIDNSLTVFTIEAWVRWNPSTTSDVNFICGKGFEQMELHTGGGAGANGIRFIPTTGVYLDAANVLPAGVWTHVAAVYEPSTTTATMYINGEEVSLTKSGSGTVGDPISDNSAQFNIGQRSNNSFFFKGSIDEVRVWNTVRSQAQVQSDMSTPISSGLGLLCSYNFDEGTADGDNTAGSTVLPDLTGNGNNGTLVDFALNGSTSNWVESYAMVVPAANAATGVSISGFTANWSAPSVGTVNNYKLYVSTDAAFNSLVTGYDPQTVASPATSSAVTGLAQNTTYYYRVCADKTTVTGEGARSNIQSLTTLILPTVTTNAASGIAARKATLNGTVNANNTSTTVTFEYGLDTDYGTTVTATPGTVTGTTETPVSASLTDLIPNQTYHYRVSGVNTGGPANGLDATFTTPPLGTWTGATNSDWATASNWDGDVLPTINTNVIIPDVANDPVISATTQAECHNLTINDGGSLTIVSNSSNTGSLIIMGSVSGSGTAIVQRYMTNNAWHMIGLPVSGQTVGSFLTGNTVIAKNPSDNGEYAMKSYNETTNNWNPLLFNSSTETMEVGYAVWPSSNGVVGFTGTLKSGEIGAPVYKTTGYGWNCIGNPYTSAIAINSDATTSNNFINLNLTKFASSYEAIYVWQQSPYGYIPINNAYSGGAYYIPVGQAFFVRTATTGNFNFSPAIQSHQNGAEFKSSPVGHPTINIEVAQNSKKCQTMVKFIGNCTPGLDVGYDAGMMKTGFDVFTRLVDDNGVDFALQCLPMANAEGYTIPVGLESSETGKVTLKVTLSDLPGTFKLMLEDRLTGLSYEVNGGSTVSVDLVAGKTLGRFYLKVSDASMLKTNTDNRVLVYRAGGRIIVLGVTGSNAVATLYDVQGRKVSRTPLHGGSSNEIPTIGMANGVYLLKVEDKGMIQTQRIQVSNE